MELIQEQLHDPWVRISDSTEAQCISLTMSEENGTADLTGQAMPEGTHVAPAPSESKPEELLSVKKGPPVAPKPNWNRQSLRSGRAGGQLSEPAKPPDKRAQDAGRTFGVSLRATSSTTKQSIKQKIHSFETFSSPETPVRGNWRLGPSTSLPLMDKAPGRSDAARCPADAGLTVNGKPTVNGRPAATRAADDESPSRDPAAARTTDPTPVTSAITEANSHPEEPPKQSEPKVEVPVPEPLNVPEPSNIQEPSSIQEPPNVPEPDGQTASPPPSRPSRCEIPVAIPKSIPAEEPLPLGKDLISVKQASLRTKSLPLNASLSSDGPTLRGLDFWLHS